MPSAPLLVVITGAPGTGKTTLGTRLGDALALPFFSKDAIKEQLFDSLGWSDRDWSRSVGGASIGLLFAIAHAQLRAGRSLILEANFRPDFATRRFARLRAAADYTAFQLFCMAAPETLTARFTARWQAGERHPGHAEDEQLATFAATHLRGAYAPLEIGGMCHTLDTTDFARVELAPLLAELRAALAAHTG